MRRARHIAAVLALVTGLAVPAATAARSSAAGDPVVEAANEAFVHQLFEGDPAACAAMTQRLAAVVVRVTRSASCPEAMDVVEQTNRELLEVGAAVLLRTTVAVAQSVQEDNLDRLDFVDAWIGPHFNVKALVQALRAATRGGDLRFVLGRSAKAARGTRSNVIVVDALKTTPRVLTLYAESDAGTIWQLQAIPTGKAKLSRTKVRGVPAPRAPLVSAVATLAGSSPTGPSVVLAEVGQSPVFSFSDAPRAEAMITRTSDGKFDKVLVGTGLVPPPPSAAGVDPSPFMPAVVGAITGGGSALCPLLHPALLVGIGISETECASDPSDPEVVTDSTPSEWIPPLADGTIVRRILSGDSGSVRVEVYLLGSTDGQSYKISGLYANILEALGGVVGDVGVRVATRP
ncbi:MAG: hypothetical protein U0R50_03960 [Gaiellales bacterium]